MYEITEEVESTLRAFVRKYRNYRPYSVYFGIVKKVFNRGMGALEFMRVVPNERAIIVNVLLWNRTDERKYDDLVKMLGGKWRRVDARYGYPEWYNHSFSFAYAIDEKERR